MSAAIVLPLTTESAMKIARQIGNYDGYTPSKNRLIEYEVTDRPRDPTYRGFITIQLRTGAQGVFDLSIRKRDGMVFDFTRCLAFDYSFLREQSPAPGRLSRRANFRATMEANGCPSFRILRRAGDEADRADRPRLPSPQWGRGRGWGGNASPVTEAEQSTAPIIAHRLTSGLHPHPCPAPLEGAGCADFGESGGWR